MTVTPPPAVFAASPAFPTPPRAGEAESPRTDASPDAPRERETPPHGPDGRRQNGPDAICDKNSTYFGK